MMQHLVYPARLVEGIDLRDIRLARASEIARVRSDLAEKRAAQNEFEKKNPPRELRDSVELRATIEKYGFFFSASDIEYRSEREKLLKAGMQRFINAISLGNVAKLELCSEPQYREVFRSLVLNLRQASEEELVIGGSALYLGFLTAFQEDHFVLSKQFIPEVQKLFSRLAPALTGEELARLKQAKSLFDEAPSLNSDNCVSAAVAFCRYFGDGKWQELKDLVGTGFCFVPKFGIGIAAVKQEHFRRIGAEHFRRIDDVLQQSSVSELSDLECALLKIRFCLMESGESTLLDAGQAVIQKAPLENVQKAARSLVEAGLLDPHEAREVLDVIYPSQEESAARNNRRRGLVEAALRPYLSPAVLAHSEVAALDEKVAGDLVEVLSHSTLPRALVSEFLLSKPELIGRPDRLSPRLNRLNIRYHEELKSGATDLSLTALTADRPKAVVQTEGRSPELEKEVLGLLADIETRRWHPETVFFILFEGFTSSGTSFSGKVYFRREYVRRNIQSWVDTGELDLHCQSTIDALVRANALREHKGGDGITRHAHPEVVDDPAIARLLEIAYERERLSRAGEQTAETQSLLNVVFERGVSKLGAQF